MELSKGDRTFEELNAALNDPAALAEYKKHHDHYRTAALPRFLGRMLVWCGNTVYGHEPSYAKFRAVEVIARVPYESWASAAYTLMTLCYTDERAALRLSEVTRYSRFAHDNETMHVVVISQFARGERTGFVRHTLVPLIFAFFYFWWSYALYLVNPRYSLELNYHFENHAFEQYSHFLEVNADMLKAKPAASAFLSWYGRHPANQYEFFRAVRNDEIIHRNSSIEEIPKLKNAR